MGTQKNRLNETVLLSIQISLKSHPPDEMNRGLNLRLLTFRLSDVYVLLWMLLPLNTCAMY